jgi:hypothetical protein
MKNILIEKACPKCNNKLKANGFNGNMPHTYYLECWNCFLSIPVKVNEPVTIGEPFAESEFYVHLVEGLDILNPLFKLYYNNSLIKSVRGNKALDIFCRIFINESTKMPTEKIGDSYCFELKEVRGSLERPIQATHYHCIDIIEKTFGILNDLRLQNDPYYVFLNFPECSNKLQEIKAMRQDRQKEENQAK